MNRLHPLMLICLTLVFFGATQCNAYKKGNDPSGYQINVPFSMQAGQLINAYADGPNIEFVKVTEDSRCPKFTNCVWAGQAVVQLKVGGEKLELAMQEGKPDLATKPLGKRIYTLKEVAPYPQADSGKIAAEDYRIVVVVQPQP